MENVTPGTSAQFPLAVSLRDDEPASDLAIDVAGFGQTAGGQYTPLPAAGDTSPYSGRSLVSISQAVIHVDPGKRVQFNATIILPKDSAPGGRYALIHIHPAPSEGGQASFATAVLVPVLITVNGSALTHTGSITSLQAEDVVSGEPVRVRAILKNTGNHHFYGALVNLTVTDSTGAAVSTESLKTIFALVPGNELTFRIPLTASLTPGNYQVKAEARIADGMVLLDSRSIPLVIQAGYKAPAPLTSPSGGMEAGPKKLPFVPIYVPGPDVLLATLAVSAALLFCSRRS